ncbi:hypothetical protein Naga_102171g1 [Nannochloropsis gaditana]|uniref:Uncharacterized protein n=1 Tax=Nannochloropsis gaditana TaxID=72520 RepID=W7TIF5_9STRA|nr:hypothetical protein Naga_102171g1 [Nannochloropsis gaditana]
MHKDSVSFRRENNIYCVSSALLNLTSSTILPHNITVVDPHIPSFFERRAQVSMDMDLDDAERVQGSGEGGNHGGGGSVPPSSSGGQGGAPRTPVKRRAITSSPFCSPAWR